MLNGRSVDDPHGEFTFCAPTGQSVVDYIIVSTSLFECIETFAVGSHDESDHFPLYCTVRVKSSGPNTQNPLSSQGVLNPLIVQGF